MIHKEPQGDLKGKQVKDEVELSMAKNQSSKESNLDETTKCDKGEKRDEVEFEDNVLEFKEFVIERVQAALMGVLMRVEGQEVNVVHDTGAEVTMTSSRVKIRKDVRPKLREAEGTLSMADSGEKLMAEGMAEVSIEGGHKTCQKMEATQKMMQIDMEDKDGCLKTWTQKTAMMEKSILSIESLKSTVEKKEKTIQSMTAQLEEFIGKFNSMMNVNESFEKALNESKHQCEQLSSILELERSTLEKKSEDIEQLQKECEELKMKLGSVQDKETEKAKSLDKLQVPVDDLGRSVDEYEVNLQGSKENVETLESKGGKFQHQSVNKDQILTGKQQENHNRDWIPTYSSLDLHDLWREDMEFRYVHKWREKGYIPPEDEADVKMVTWEKL
jgi:uncharacterized protein YoxC